MSSAIIQWMGTLTVSDSSPPAWTAKAVGDDITIAYRSLP